MRGPQSRTRETMTQAFIFVLFALVIAALFTLVVLAANTYRSLVGADESSGVRRAALSTVVSSIKAADRTGAVSIVDGPEGPMLVLADATSDSSESLEPSYVTRIYLSDGQLVEEYTTAGAGLDPDEATKLVQTTSFDVSYADTDLIRIVTDEGTAYVALRSSQSDGTVAPVVQSTGTKAGDTDV